MAIYRVKQGHLGSIWPYIGSNRAIWSSTGPYGALHGLPGPYLVGRAMYTSPPHPLARVAVLLGVHGYHCLKVMGYLNIGYKPNSI